MNSEKGEEQWDFIIIGAGICGLSLGALLVNDGYRILILEKAKSIGGRAKVIEKNGFVLDYGIHTIRFGKKSSLAKTLKTIKTDDQDLIEYRELGLSYFFLESDNETHWTVFPSGISGITKGTYFKLSKLLKLIRKLVILKKKKKLAISVDEWQKKKKLNEPSRIFLRFITSSMQVCPFLDRASIGELKRNLMEVVKKRISVTYPIGGWKLIYERLTEKINTNGKILTDYQVDELLTETLLQDEKYRAVGVKCGDKKFFGKKVINSVPVQNIFEFLDENKCDSEFIELCKNLKPTAGLSLDIGLKKKISDETGLFFLDNPLSFGFFTSNLDEGSAPDEKQLFTFCSPFDVEDLKNKDFGNELLAKLREKLFKAFPDMKDNIEFERPLFTIFDGVEVNINQYRELRPGFKIPGIKNLYLVGDCLSSKGAGGDIGHNSVWDSYAIIKKEIKN